MQVEVEAALADAEAGELAGVWRKGGQFDILEAGGDIQAVHRVERRQLAFDADRRVLVDLALNIDAGGFRALVVECADLAIELLDGRGEVRRQTEVGKVRRTVLDADTADAHRQRFTR